MCCREANENAQFYDELGARRLLVLYPNQSTFSFSCPAEALKQFGVIDMLMLPARSTCQVLPPPPAPPVLSRAGLCETSRTS